MAPVRASQAKIVPLVLSINHTQEYLFPQKTYSPILKISIEERVFRKLFQNKFHDFFWRKAQEFVGGAKSTSPAFITVFGPDVPTSPARLS